MAILSECVRYLVRAKSREISAHLPAPPATASPALPRPDTPRLASLIATGFLSSSPLLVRALLGARLFAHC